MWQTHDGWWMVFGGSLWIVFWLAALYVVLNVTAPRRAGGEQRGGVAREKPSEVARRRYASGEIDRDEYLRLIEDLHPTDPAAASRPA